MKKLGDYMYKLSVVDDEAVILERLTQMIETIDPNLFELEYTFSNGDDAYNQLSQTPPDILITDIEIPFINGLELIKMLRRNNPLLKVIVITGYDQIDYAKEAIDLGVISFISKPILKEDLSKALNKAVLQIEQEFHLEANMSELASFFKDNVSILKETHLNKLVTLDKTSHDYIERLHKLGLFLDYSFMKIAVFDFDNEASSNLEQLWGYLNKEFRQVFSGILDYNLFQKDNKIYALLKAHQKIDESLLIVNIELIITKLNKYFNMQLSVGLSKTSDNLEHNFKEIYNEANIALSMRRAFGGLQVFTFNDLKLEEPTKQDFDDSSYETITYKVKYETDLEKLSHFFDTIKEELAKGVNNYSFYISNILNAIIKATEGSFMIDQKLVDFNELYIKLFNFKTIDELCNWFFELSKNVQKSNLAHIENRIDYNMEKIISYIENNYTNPNLNLDTLADEMTYSVSYITSLFKKNLNTTFVKYLTQVRMIKAKEILFTTNYKVVEISQMLGFNEPYYFSHCFKKYYGMSPKEYKDANL